MAVLLISAVLSFALCLLLTPLARAWAPRLNLLDNPDGRRKLHGRSIAVAGGPAILVSIAVAVLTAFSYPSALSSQTSPQTLRLLALLMAALLICIVGVFDDLGRLRGRHKLVGQLAAVAIVLAAGVRIDGIRLLHADFNLGVLAVPFTAFFLVGAINSLNLLDGMDGLLTSIALVICFVLGCLAVLAGKQLTACLAFTTTAALLAFLRYNFPPATIFLGDSGSMLIGLVVGVLAIDSSLDRSAHLSLTAPLALLTLPIFDTATALLRRKLTGRSIFSTDRSHLHHCLLRRFGDPHRVLAVLLCCGVVLGGGVLAGRMLDSDLIGVFAALTVVALLIGLRLFGHAEWHTAMRHLRLRLFSALRSEVTSEPRCLEVRLHGTANWQELCERIMDWNPSLNVCRLRLDVNAPALGEGYHARWDCGPDILQEDEVLWRAHIPLAVKGGTIGEMEISGRRDEKSLSDKIALLAQIIQDFECMVSQVADGAALSMASPTFASPTRYTVNREKPELHGVDREREADVAHL